VNDTRSTLPPNTILVDGFRIERFIGAGGFGITYLGEDLHLGTTVAIKEYYPDEFGDRDASLSVRPKTDRHRQTFEWGRTSFLQEARMLARFRHQSIVRITRVFEANATAYMVMEFEEGRSLESWLKSLARPPTQAELDRIVAPLLDALEMMHADSFLHRDIAPDNIIIRPDGTPVLLDFGAARRAMAEQSRVLTGIIKAGYSPQEQYATDGRLQGPWSDLYALGATLYRAVTGKPPEEATLRAGDDQTPPATKAATGDFRPEFLAAIDTCLNVDRKKRPQSVAELRPMLLGAERPVGEPASRRWSTVVLRENGISASRAWVLTAVTVAVLLGGTLVGTYYAHWGGTERLPPSVASGAEAAWAAVKDSTSIPTIEAFIARFQGSFYADLARLRIADLKQPRAEREERAEAARKAEAEALAAWEAVQRSTSIPELEAYVRRYPESRFADLARARIDEVKAQMSRTRPPLEFKPVPVGNYMIERGRAVEGRQIFPMVSVNGMKSETAVAVCSKACDASVTCNAFNVSIEAGWCTLFSSVNRKSPADSYMAATRQ
jgi:hypothetical protein